MLDVLLTILKVMWWLFNTIGSGAAMFMLASLVGYAAGRYRQQHPRWKTERPSIAVGLMCGALLALICAIPIVNWIIAILLWVNDDEVVEELLHEAEYTFDGGETDDTEM